MYTLGNRLSPWYKTVAFSFFVVWLRLFSGYFQEKWVYWKLNYNILSHNYSRGGLVFFLPSNKFMHINGFPHSKRLNNQQQKVERVSVQHTVNRHKRSQKLIRHLVLWPLSQISECLMDPACNRLVFLMSLSPPRSSLPAPPPHIHVSSMFFCLLSHLFFFYLFGCQTYGSMTWWSWCWRSAYLRSPTVSATCCCARLGFYWACSTATSLCERSVRLMSTGESFCTFFDYSYFRIMKRNNRSVLFF